MIKLPIGTFINMLTVTIGSLIGMALQQSFPPEIKIIVFQAIGLCVLLIGLNMSQRVPEGYMLILIFSMLIGGIIGQTVQIDLFLDRLGENIKTLFSIESAGFTEGLITTFLIFCIGSMTIVGAIEEGLSGKKELLMMKSLLDGVTAIALASTYGIGVLFSIVPMLIFQGGITVLAGLSQGFFTQKMIGMLSSTGGLLILGLGLNILEMTQIRIENLLPAVLVAALLAWAYETYENKNAPSKAGGAKKV